MTTRRKPRRTTPHASRPRRVRALPLTAAQLAVGEALANAAEMLEPGHATNQAAFERRRAEIEAVDPSECVSVNVDVPLAIARVGAALPRILALREQIATELPRHDLAPIDALQDYRHALLWAYSRARNVARPAGIGPLVAEGRALRTRLVLDARTLARRGLIDRAVLARLSRTTSHTALQSDLLLIATILREVWVAIAGRSLVTLDELERCEQLSTDIATAIGVKRRGRPEAGPEKVLMRKAYTVFARAYAHAQRAVQYLRFHEGDADRFAPSLLSGRKVGKRRPKAA